jgi:predicted HTH transcriptional regulator
MTLRELRQLVSLGEGISLEFKRKVPRAERIAKEVIALANTHGGRILLGVDDDGAILGVDDAGEEEFVLHRAVDAHVVPSVTYHTERIPIAGRRDVILVTVPESPDKPHHLVAEPEIPPGDGTAYVRVEEMSVEASPESLEMMREEATGAGVTFQFGDNESLLMRYLEDYGRVTVTQFARMADLPHQQASQTLLRLARANVLQLHADRGEDYFTLAY